MTNIIIVIYLYVCNVYTKVFTQKKILDTREPVNCQRQYSRTVKICPLFVIIYGKN